MLTAYHVTANGCSVLPQGTDLAQAQWIDLYRPLNSQVAQAEALGAHIPTLEDMEEIEISNRLYHEDGTYYMTAVLPGETPEGMSVAAPVTFILMPQRMITVRHHAPRPFRTFPEHAERGTVGINTTDRLFLSLLDEIVSRLADILEGVGRVLDDTTNRMFEGQVSDRSAFLQKSLERVGVQGDVLARVRLGLLSVERILLFYSNHIEHRFDADEIKPIVKARFRDIKSLEVHANFLSGRVKLVVDATLGLVSLQQNDTVKILSAVAALFMPPTLIASAYGMNFDVMPELHWRYSYPVVLVLMLGSSVATYLFLKWKNWL